MLPMFGILKRLLLSVLSHPPKTHACACIHTYTCTQTCTLFEVSTQTSTLIANLEGIKSRRLSSVLSWFPSLHGTDKSRISKACPKVTGCLLRFPWSASHMPGDSGRASCNAGGCLQQLLPECRPFPPGPHPSHWSSWKMEPTWCGSQNRKGH